MIRTTSLGFLRRWIDAFIFVAFIFVWEKYTVICSCILDLFQERIAMSPQLGLAVLLALLGVLADVALVVFADFMGGPSPLPPPPVPL